MPRSRFFLPCLLWCAGAVQAAELGDAAVRSWLGQPLVVDIELLPDEGGAVRAYPAHAEVYRQANVAPAPLDTAHLSVMRRDGRQFLHLTSIEPVARSPLVLFLELEENGRMSVREMTLWLTPEPPPAAPARAVLAPAPPPAPHAARPPARHAAAALDARACAALDYRNGQLQAQIVDLEEKVKLLQSAFAGAAPVRAPVHAAGRAPVAPPPAAHPPAHAPAGAPVRPPAAPPAARSWIWLAGAAALLVVLGGGAGYVVLRKRRGKGAAGPGKLAGLLGRLRRKRPAPATPEAPREEPTA